MRTVFLHIGVFKTGSSALQVFFAKNQKQLAAAGVCYPSLSDLDGAKRGLVSSGNAAYLARSLMEPEAAMALPRQKKDQLRKFEKSLKRTTEGNLLFSTEFFTYVPTDSFRTLNEIANHSGYRLKVVGFVREQTSYLESLYIQRVKRGGIQQPPEEYIEKLIEDEKHLFYAKFFEELSVVFEHDNIGLEIYERKNLYSKMFSQLDLEPSKQFTLPSRRVNISLPLALIPLFLELNKLNPPQSFADQVVGAYSKFNDKKESGGQTLLSPELRTRLVELYKPDNDKLFADWFTGTTAFPLADRKYVSLDSAAKMLDLADIAKLLGGISIQHEARLIRVEKAIMQLGELAGLEDGWATKIKVR